MIDPSKHVASRPGSPFEPAPASVCRFDDPEVWEMIATGGARAVHHIESPAMIGLCRMTNVREIDGLIAIVSVIRPGAANEQKKLRFTRRYQGLEPVEYPHPCLEPVLEGTYGLVVYEEHILQICEAYAGLPAGRADVLRRALNKHQEPVIEEIRGEFFAAARRRGHDEDNIREVWSLVSGFSGYAFCKAHSTAYGVEAYQSAWLKRYYPVEFMAAVLTHGKGFYHPLVYILECHRLGIRILPPSVFRPGPGFRPERSDGFPSDGASPDSIRVPVSSIKGMTDATLKRLLEAQAQGPFRHLQDFHHRVRPLPEEMELLVRAGALDEFGPDRTLQFWEVQALRQRHSGRPVEGQSWLALEETSVSERVPDSSLSRPSRRQKLEWEAELLGFCAGGHPLDLYDDVAWETYCPIERLGEFPGREVVVCGLVIEQRIHQQVTGEPMKFITIADRTGIIETELFAPTYRAHGLATVRYPVLEVTARVEPFENGRGHTLRVLRANRPRQRR